MKKRTILERYYEWAEAGYIDNKAWPEKGPSSILGNGLCYSSIVDDYPELFDLVTPHIPRGYWGFNEDGSKFEYDRVDSSFNPLRQNIVLLMAAMAGEL